jgi:NAD(P)-dependent dehydrogenase (short-subunit alcohol dehydrogenase family)
MTGGGTERTVLITGCSSGLGLSTAVHLAETTWRVYASMRDPSRRQALDIALKVADVDPDRVKVIGLDVTDSESIRSALDEIAAETGGRLDALVNNAGMNLEACLEDLEMAEVRRGFDTIVLGAIELTRAALPILRKAPDPRLVFISSYVAVMGVPTSTMYAAAKAAIELFAEALVWEVAADGITVVVIRPGTHRSNIFDGNSGRVRPPDSHYRKFYERVDPLAHAAVIKHARDPERFARKVGKILDARHPGFRYHVGFDAYLATVVDPLIPHRLRRAVARRAFKR